MEIPWLGEVMKDEQLGKYCSKQMRIEMFGGKECRIVLDLEDYDEDDRKEEFHIAIANFLSSSPAVLREADEPLFRYYRDFEEYWVEDNNQPIESAKDLWQHVRFGSKALVRRRRNGDKRIYVSVECGCDWEQEHGLQLVLKNGLKVTKLGGYDGHLTNSDAYDNEGYEGVIYPER